MRAYESLALDLARDPARLAGYRERLRENRPTHPLFDMARFVAALDDRLCAAWENRTSPASPQM
jgi:protein O-GlcNAc transferase